MRALETLGGETWFNLGDGDLALHLERTRRLNNGETATQVARDLRRHLGIQADLIPPCDEPVRTLVHTASEGTLPLQRYFVERRCEPAITGFSFQGAQAAEISPSRPGGSRRPGPRRHPDLPVQSIHQHRSPASGARTARGPSRRSRASHSRVTNYLR